MDSKMKGMTPEERNEFEKSRLGQVGLKYDHGKPRMELLTTEFLIGTAKVLTVGAEKYDADNWKRGMKWRRVYGSMQRHLSLWLSGEDLDPETGLSHLHHAACNLMFLSSYQHNNIGEDDREHKVYEKLRLEELQRQGIEEHHSIREEIIKQESVTNGLVAE